MTASSEGLVEPEDEIIDYLKRKKEINPLIGVDKYGLTHSLLLKLVELNLEKVIELDEVRLAGHTLDEMVTKEEIVSCLRKTSSQKVAHFLFKELMKRSDTIKGIYKDHVLHLLVEKDMGNVLSMILQELPTDDAWTLLGQRDEAKITHI